MSRLSGEALKAAVAPLREELGRADRRRLDELVRLAVGPRARLSECLEAAFPELAGAKGLAALRAFRKRVNEAAGGAEPRLEISLCMDSRKAPSSQRWCWFEGPDPAVVGVTRYSQQVTAGLDENKLERSLGVVTTRTALEKGKRLVRFFRSYAHKDTSRVDELMSGLESHFGASRSYEYQLWSDGDILVGEDWKQRIDRAIESCDFGILLVSPAFLSRRFIRDHELPRFVGERASKPVIPVGFGKVDFERHDLRGLDAKQLFLRKRSDGGGLFYMDPVCTKNEFVSELFVAIEKRIDAFFGAGAEQMREEDVEADHSGAVPLPETLRHFQRTRAYSVALDQLEKQEGQNDAQARDALTEIEAWAVNPEAPPFFAVLGEYGIGKTTTLKHLTRDWLQRRPKEPKLPLPIYVDLRDYVGEKHAVPDIESLLTEVIKRSWRVRDRTVTAQDVLRLVREEGAVILFDGLDEKVVHLPPDRAREFIRTLWSVLPDAGRRPDALPAGKRRGKLLISCRSHYFPDVWQQNAMLVGEDREGLDRATFPAICLLPFSEEQIRSYLASVQGDEARARETFDLIASIHDLTDLARRPYLLSLIIGQIRELEELKARGEAVNAARLYDLVVRSWLNRDAGKHQIEPEHKRRLMEDLAAELWREGSKQWTVGRLETWLDDYLLRNPATERAYANKDRAVLKEDLRTATFVLRPDTEREHFRFAHTSLQEYFLARHLLRALEEGKPERWNLPMVSRETLDFLGQMLGSTARPATLQAMEEILGGERLEAAVLAFKYWLRALEARYPVPAAKRVRLAGANLAGWDIRGRGVKQPLDLQGADLSGAHLNRARLQDVDLRGAKLSGLDARQSVFQRVDLSGANARRADFGGQSWRDGSLQGADISEAQLSGCYWIGVKESSTSSPAAEGSRGPILPDGHHGAVRACAWSPDGRRLLSASDDHSLKVWDASSGRCLLTLEGHSRPVQACAWSPDARRLLSASDDQSLKVWDASSGACLLSIEGRSGPVQACDWSPDGQRLLSAAADGSLKIWEVSSGQCLLSIEGHSRPVQACRWSPDGRRLLSASADRTLKVWDASSGEGLLVLTGHTSWALACEWSPDGQRLLSASADRSLRVWDASSGQCLLSIEVSAEGHSRPVLACAWSPDGRRLLSASADRTLKVWDASSGRCLLSLDSHSGPVQACDWSPDGERLLSASADRSMNVWEASSGRCLLRLGGHVRPVLACGWSADGQRLVSGSTDSSLKIWDASSGRCLLTFRAHSSWILRCAWSPDGQRLASASADSSIKVWETSSGRCLLTIRGHSRGVWACAWSPDGQRLVSVSTGNSLKVWEVSTGDCLLTLRGHSGIWACAWSPDGQHLLSGSADGSLGVWDVSSRGLHVLREHSGAVLACAWSPDGQRLLSASADCSLKVWAASSGRCLLSLEGHRGPVRACAWSPDGQRLLSASRDRTLRVWDAASGRCLLALEGHSRPAEACAWSPDGQHLLSSSEDNTLKVWDARSGRCLWTGHVFPEGQTATVDELNGKVVSASEGAWRWLGWQWVDPATGHVHIAPL